MPGGYAGVPTSLLAPGVAPKITIVGPGVGPTADWTPAGYTAATQFIEIGTNGAGNNVISGITGGFANRVLALFVNGTQTLVMNHNDVASAAGNRFQVPGGGAWSILNFGTTLIRWDVGLNAWTIFGRGL